MGPLDVNLRRVPKHHNSTRGRCSATRLHLFLEKSAVTSLQILLGLAVVARGHNSGCVRVVCLPR